jgi:hypothetical protein
MDTAATPPPTLLAMLRREMRDRQMSLRTADTCVYWVRHFVRFRGRRHPRELGAAEAEAYLTMLANRRCVAASTHNQALSALLFLYRAVLKVELPWLDNLQRPGGRSACPSSCRWRESRPCCRGCTANTACWRGCCTAPACGSARRCGCA